MKYSFCRLIGLVLTTLGAGSGLLRADEISEVIAKARAFLGSEAALDSVRSVHYTGVLTKEGEKPDDKKTIQIEIIFQKPYRQRIVATYPDKVDVTALDDYEGWNRIEDPKDRSRWRMVLLNKDQVIRLRVNTWETLSFFRGIERRGGHIEDMGVVPLENRPSRKLAFVHDHGILFMRYFDVGTGKLLLSETEQGGTIREEGELFADGIRFPKTIVTTAKQPNGNKQSISITFDSVKINETFGDEVFAVPTASSAPAPGPGR